MQKSFLTEEWRAAGVSQIDRVVEAVEETLKGNTVQILEKKALPKLDLPKVSLCPAVAVCDHWAISHIFD